MPPKPRRKKGGVRRKGDREKDVSKSSAAVHCNAEAYTGSFLRKNAAAALLCGPVSRPDSTSPVNRAKIAQSKCHAKACREDDFAKLCCLICSREFNFKALGIESIVRSALSDAPVGSAQPLIEVNIPITDVVSDLKRRFIVDTDDGAAKPEIDDDVEALGISQEPVLAAVHAQLSKTERATLTSKIGLRYSAKPVTNSDEVIEYGKILEHIESHVTFHPPSVVMSAEHFPYVTRFPSIKDYIGILTQLGEEAIIWNSVKVDETPVLSEPVIGVSDDGSRLSCTFYTLDDFDEAITSLKSGKPVESSLPDTFNIALQNLLKTQDESVTAVQPANGNASARDKTLEACNRGFTIACMRIAFFNHAIEKVKVLEDDIRDADTTCISPFAVLPPAGEDLPTSKSFQAVTQLLRSEAVCEYVSQALKQQLTDVKEKILQARKVRDSIASILERKGNARMDLERKIMRAGKRASEVAVQRAFERHVEDLKEELPLQNQKRESEAELLQREHYEIKLVQELTELESIRERLAETRAALQGEMQSSANASAVYRVNAEAPPDPTLRAAQKGLDDLLEVIARRRVAWEDRQAAWTAVKHKIGDRLRAVLPHENAVRESVYRVVCKSVASEMTEIISSEKIRIDHAREAAFAQAKAVEAELVKAEEAKAKRAAVKEAKQKAREAKRLEAERLRLEAEQAAAHARRIEEAEAEAVRLAEKRAVEARERQEAEVREAKVRELAAREYDQEQKERKTLAATAWCVAEGSHSVTSTAHARAESSHLQRDNPSKGSSTNNSPSASTSSHQAASKSSDSAWPRASTEPVSSKSPKIKPKFSDAADAEFTGHKSSVMPKKTRKGPVELRDKGASLINSSETVEKIGSSGGKDTVSFVSPDALNGKTASPKAVPKTTSTSGHPSPQQEKQAVESNVNHGDTAESVGVILPSTMKNATESKVSIDITFGDMGAVTTYVRETQGTVGDDALTQKDSAPDDVDDTATKSGILEGGTSDGTHKSHNTIEIIGANTAEPAGSSSSTSDQKRSGQSDETTDRGTTQTEDEDADTASYDSQGSTENRTASPNRPLAPPLEATAVAADLKPFVPQHIQDFNGTFVDHPAAIAQHQQYGMYSMPPAGMAYYYGYQPHGFYSQGAMQYARPHFAGDPARPPAHGHAGSSYRGGGGGNRGRGKKNRQPKNRGNHRGQSSHSGPQKGSHSAEYNDGARVTNTDGNLDDAGAPHFYAQQPLTAEQQQYLLQMQMMHQMHYYGGDQSAFGYSYGMMPPQSGNGALPDDGETVPQPSVEMTNGEGNATGE